MELTYCVQFQALALAYLVPFPARFISWLWHIWNSSSAIIFGMIPSIGILSTFFFNAGILVTVFSVSMLSGIRGVVVLTNRLISAIYDINGEVYISI